jgi:DnaJ like chaperone protein
MSIWTRIAEALTALANGEPLAAVFERLRTPPERTVAFTIAVIALGAKMAKADGQVSRSEVTAFREVFTIAKKDEAQAARVFNLARQDVAGFDAYARKVAGMFGPGDRILADVLDGLLYVAAADGDYHPLEDGYLREVARIFGIGEAEFRTIAARHTDQVEADPHDVLGIPRGSAPDDIRAAWKRLVRETHPDAMLARGVPPEAVRLAEKRLAAINRAWAELGGKAAA